MTTLPTERLAKLIARKHEVLVELRQLGLQQIELVNQGEVPALLKLLAAKQEMITNLHAVENELVPFRNQDPDSRNWPSSDARARCAEQAAACNELLGEVVYLEKQSEDRMIARRDQVANQLQQVYSAAQARGAYQVHQAHAVQNTHAQHAAKRNSSAPPQDGSPVTGGLDLVCGN